jgi:hypothetical protein
MSLWGILWSMFLVAVALIGIDLIGSMIPIWLTPTPKDKKDQK